MSTFVALPPPSIITVSPITVSLSGAPDVAFPNRFCKNLLEIIFFL